MHVGSIHEKDDEQGVAHFVEHVTFLGSTKREALITLGVRSNAYTDFHHTVFHMSADMKSDMYQMDMLPHVVDALAEVAFRAQFLRTRIEKERKAVLAEAQMMNTIEYRMDCQLLRYLHEENELGRLFPIGQVDQVRCLFSRIRRRVRFVKSRETQTPEIHINPTQIQIQQPGFSVPRGCVCGCRCGVQMSLNLKSNARKPQATAEAFEVACR